MQSTDIIIEDKIVHILDMFPKISPSMLQISLGSGISSSIWKPVLERLIEEEKVYRYQEESVSPGGRHQSLTVISSQPK
jgi:hypothetical protein